MVEKTGQVIAVERLMKMEIPELIDYIIETHHTKERCLLNEIDELLNTVLLVHYEQHSEQLVPLHGVFSDLRKELQEHFVKEEKLIFPYIIRSYFGDINSSYVKS